MGAAQLAEWFNDTLLRPLTSFFRNNGVSIALGLLGFIFLFKIGEAFMGKMSIVFYREIGFSKSDIGLYSKGLGWITTVVFTLVGGWFSMRSGTVRTLFIAGIAMAATNVLFSILAWVGKSELLFAVAVVLDDLAAAFATVAFVTFISLMVDRRYTATQYALLASIGTAGRTTLAASSGLLVDWLGGDWGLFFILTAVMVTPSLVLLMLMAPRIRLGQSGSPEDQILKPDKRLEWFGGGHGMMHIGMEQCIGVGHDADMPFQKTRSPRTSPSEGSMVRPRVFS